MTRRSRKVVLLLALTSLAGCAYFNALYNARRLYGEAESAANRGDLTAAEVAYRESLDKAARSLERDPAGRWSDDALLLIARNQFALGDCRAARAALQRVLGETRDTRLAAEARAYLGAASQCLGEPAAAIAHLDEAIPDLDSDGVIAAFAHLWRARALFALGRADSAWTDLETASVRNDALGRTASLEQIARALEFDRSPKAITGFRRLLDDPAGDLYGDSVRVLAVAASERWGGAVAREALAPAPRAPWAGDIRDLVIVERARQAALAGDTAAALRELAQAASRSTARAANAARIELARLRFARASDPSELAEIRAILLPAISEQSVRPLVNDIGVMGALLAQAQRGQPLALFAAAELARDRLHAPVLARRLFTGYADVAGATPWSTKAIIAALALDPPSADAAALNARFAAASDIYAVAARGSVPAGFEDSERRLDQALQGLVARATRDAGERDIAVGEAIAEMDSLTAAVRADSLSLSCGSLADSLGLAGLLRDSVNAACLREDPVMIDSFLRADTMLWRDTMISDEERVRPSQPADSAASSTSLD